jgi:hypothetical protein
LNCGGAVRPLGQHLKRVLRAGVHHVEHALDEVQRDVLVKEVAHGVDEDHPRQPPAQWVTDGIVVEKDRVVPSALTVDDLQIVRRPPGVVAVVALRLRDRRQPLCHSLGIAVLAPGRHLVAARGGVPCLVGPFDLGAHFEIDYW